VAAVHLIGPTADVTLYRGRATVRLASDLYPDFALVRPLALDERTPREALAGTKSTLAAESYYYAVGLTTTGRVEASYRGLRAGLGAGFSTFNSIEGLDRHQHAYVSPTGIPHEAITNDVELTDDRLDLRLFSEAPLPLTDVKLGVTLDYQRRAGTMGDLQRTRSDVRLGLHASYAM
jgi:hypothetical protein